MLRETISTEGLIADDAVAGSVSFFFERRNWRFCKENGDGSKPWHLLFTSK